MEAEGQAEAIKRVADAQKYEIDTVYTAIHQGNPTNDLLAIKYMETLSKVADGKASKIFLGDLCVSLYENCAAMFSEQ